MKLWLEYDFHGAMVKGGLGQSSESTVRADFGWPPKEAERQEQNSRPQWQEGVLGSRPFAVHEDGMAVKEGAQKPVLLAVVILFPKIVSVQPEHV